MKTNHLLRKKILFLVLFSFILSLPGLSLAAPTEVYFSPKGGAEAALEELIDSAKGDIRAALYFFTSRPLSSAILRAHKRGVKIQVIIDGNRESDYSKGFYLRQRGVDVRYARGLPKKARKSKKRKYRMKGFGLMHHKFMVVDDKTLATGSYNWTASAEKWNRENLLIIKSSSLARKYTVEFKEIWESTFIK
ncbi:MAG: phospholipase D-like domain-containing protein [Pseudomonadota bacterium]|nr:phospholipase D-like domain-containing protein [Pseudomonadota bacterium]